MYGLFKDFLTLVHQESALNISFNINRINFKFVKATCYFKNKIISLMLFYNLEKIFKISEDCFNKSLKYL